jgi:hypothetical protein
LARLFPIVEREKKNIVVPFSESFFPDYRWRYQWIVDVFGIAGIFLSQGEGGGTVGIPPWGIFTNNWGIYTREKCLPPPHILNMVLILNGYSHKQ